MHHPILEFSHKIIKIEFRRVRVSPSHPLKYKHKTGEEGGGGTRSTGGVSATADGRVGSAGKKQRGKGLRDCGRGLVFFVFRALVCFEIVYPFGLEIYATNLDFFNFSYL